MKVQVWITRYGSPERRTVEVDLQEGLHQALKDQVGGIGGVDEELILFQVEGIEVSSIPYDLI